MSTPDDLESLLSEALPAADPSPAVERAAGTDREAPTGETLARPAAAEPSAAPPADATPADATGDGSRGEPEHVPFAVVRDERRKRQELERKLREIEARVSAPQGQPQQPEAPSWDLDPQKAAEHFQQQLQVQRYQDKVALMEEVYREKHADFDAVTELVVAAAQSDPALHQKILTHPNPVKFAYEHGRQLKLLAEVGTDPEAYRAKLEAEFRAKYGLGEDGSPTAPSNSKPPASRVPRSLARDVSHQARDTRGRWDGPVPLEELLT